MIEEDIMKQLNNGKDFEYSTEHFNVRIKLNKRGEIIARLEIKGTDISYKEEMPIYEFDEIILGEDDIECWLESVAEKIKEDLFKEIIS
jgi:hypothetical protein